MMAKTTTADKRFDKKAVVLLSGGLDSATVLAMASAEYDCVTLSFDYHQRHRSELVSAQRLSEAFQVSHHYVITLDNTIFAGSALTDETIDVPLDKPSDIPVTYVPARNTVFLAHALALAEVIDSVDIFIGVNAIDYSGYPDCRQAYIDAFSNMANLATKAAVNGHQLTVHTPLIDMTKAEIVKAGDKLGVDYSLTVSCYQADAAGLACGECDSCRFRKAGFEEAGLLDPTRYVIG